MNKTSIYHHRLNLQAKEVIFSYKGPVSVEVINEICKDIEEEFNTNTITGKKIYSIFMEVAQNIFFYSFETCELQNEKTGVGSLVISQTQEFYTLIAGNFIPNDRVKTLEEKCKRINALDRASLRRLKFNQHESENTEPNSRGAGVGLIQIALTSGESLNTEFRKIDESKTFFTLAVNIKKI